MLSKSIRYLRCLSKSYTDSTVRRNVTIYQSPRFMCHTGVEEIQTGREEKDIAEKNQHTTSVLKFFNLCDFVTLKRLIALNPDYLRNVNAHKIIHHGNSSRRFEDVEELKSLAHLTDKDIVTLSQLIKKLKKLEASAAGIKGLKPPLDLSSDELQELDKIVVVDLYQCNVAWAEQNIHTREVTQVGKYQMFNEINKFSYVYKPLEHHREISHVMKQIPQAKLYLMSTGTQGKSTVSKKMMKYVIHQAVLEAIFVTLLNNKATLLHKSRNVYKGGIDKKENMMLEIDDEVTDCRSEMFYGTARTMMEINKEKNRLDNSGNVKVLMDEIYEDKGQFSMEHSHEGKGYSQADNAPLVEDFEDAEEEDEKLFVHLFDFKQFDEFYDGLTTEGELLAECSKFIKEWYGNPGGPLSGLAVYEEDLEQLTKYENVARCVLMADIFSRTVHKQEKMFPRSYSYFKS